MKPPVRILFGALVALFALVHADAPAGACAGGPEPVSLSMQNPDMPLTRFAAGDLGIVRATLARSYLVVAFRTLEGLPLDPIEQKGALDVWSRRLKLVDLKYLDPTGQQVDKRDAATDAVAAWQQARARVTPPGPSRVETDYYDPAEYNWIQNCLPDAFRAAEAHLRALLASAPADPQRVATWALAQDQVFSNCDVAPPYVPKRPSGQTPHASIPSPLPSTASLAARRDRAYQIAAAELYAGEWNDAEAAFDRIARDPADPNRAVAAYLLARAYVRGAPKSPDPGGEYRKALAQIDAILGDPTMAAMAPAAARYRTLVLSRLDPAARVHDAAVRLATEHVEGDMETLLSDYTLLLDKDPSALALTAPDTDRLSAWIGVLKAEKRAPAFQRAAALFGRTHDVAWLLAALVAAESGKDPAVAPLLDAAATVPATSPAFPTLAVEWARLSRGRGVPDAAIFAELRDAEAKVGAAASPSTKNELTLDEARAAPSVGDLAARLALTPAGRTEWGSATVPDASLVPVIPEEIARWLARLPLATWSALALSPVLAPAAKAPVRSAAWVRAMLLGDGATAHAVAPAAEAANPQIRDLIATADAATTQGERRITFLSALLHAPRLGPDVHAWETSPTSREPIDSSLAGYLWCKIDPRAPVGTAAFLSADDVTTATAEMKALATKGSGATFVANEAAALAREAPTDPRVPELLHLAVRMTRYGCRDEQNLSASKGAFDALHEKYPHSPWTAKTPYYFGAL